MTEPIGPSPAAPIPPSTAANVPVLSKQMQEQVTRLADDLRKILDDPSLCAQARFLHDIADIGTKLNHTVEQSQLVR